MNVKIDLNCTRSTFDSATIFYPFLHYINKKAPWIKGLFLWLVKIYLSNIICLDFSKFPNFSA